MLHQENSNAFVSVQQLARAADDGCSNFLPEKDDSGTEWNVIACPVASAVKEVTVDPNKRHASGVLPDMVDCKRIKHEDQNTSGKYHYAADSDVGVPEYKGYKTCEIIFDPPAYESEESEDEDVHSPANFALAHAYVEDYLRSASFYQREHSFSSVGVCPTRKPVPIGRNYQAELPECTYGKNRRSIDDYAGRLSASHIRDGSNDESDKWIKNCVIPMPGTVELSSMLRHVCSKADCNCVDEDSIECVRKHVKEARERLKDAFGTSAFKELGFCDMGEEVALRWTEEEEHLFQKVVSSNPASLGRNFWDALPLAFPFKTSKELVSYYFNVFMLRKRAEQNRFDPTNADSDDDEWQGSDEDEFVSTESMPVESLTDQDDVACNLVALEWNIHEESSDEDEFDSASGDMQETYCTDGDAMVSAPFVDHNQETFRFGADDQDDSCTSFEARQVGVADGAQHADVAEDHYGFGGVADHGYFGAHGDPKAWDDISFRSGWEEHEFLSTNNVIEEVFGKGSWENEKGSSGGQDIITM